MTTINHLAPSQLGYYSVLERYAIELRKYGMGLVVIATRLTLEARIEALQGGKTEASGFSASFRL